MNIPCESRFIPGQGYHCERCNLSWDYNDPDRPECLTAQQIAHDAITQTLSNDHVPIHLKGVTYNNENLVISFTCGRFEGISLPVTASVKGVVEQLRNLATIIERNIK